MNCRGPIAIVFCAALLSQATDAGPVTEPTTQTGIEDVPLVKASVGPVRVTRRADGVVFLDVGRDGKG